MVNYQTIAELVSQIPVDTWNVLLEIKQRRPAMMLSELAANTDGRREIVGRQIGHSEAETFWSGFLKRPTRPGLRGQAGGLGCP